MKALLTLAHGAGAGMNHVFMASLADELANLGIGTIRFNFPFTEQKKKRPDFPAVAHLTIASVFEFARQQYPSTPVYLSGKSFGGRMSSQLLATNKIEDAKGIILFGFPLHPAGKPSIERAAHLKDVKIPMLFLQGTRDTLAEWDLIETVCNELTLATLVKFEGADHSFKAGKQNIIPLLATSANDWIASL
jgi:predicted alpha/beta-hydrolase family hydrolase